MFNHVLALLIFIGRSGDVLSTLSITPSMTLEANPVVRRFKWPMMILGFGLCALPYFDIQIAIVAAVLSLLVTASNLSRGWMARALGDKEMERIVLRAAAAGSLPVTLAMYWTAAAFIVLTAGLLIWISDGDNPLVNAFAVGLGLYGVSLALYGTFYFIGVFRRSRLERADAAHQA